MPRARTIRQSIYPYHVTTRSNDQMWFEIPMQEVWNIALRALRDAHERQPIELISFVLMNNHYHLILKTPLGNIDKFMMEFNARFSKGIRFQCKRRNRIWGGRYHWCLIKSNHYLQNCYRYVYQNPIRASIVSRAENYPYSTLFYIHRSINFIIPIFDQYGFKDDYGLKWLNDEIESIDKIRKGLKGREY